MCHLGPDVGQLLRPLKSLFLWGGLTPYCDLNLAPKGHDIAEHLDSQNNGITQHHSVKSVELKNINKKRFQFSLIFFYLKN